MSVKRHLHMRLTGLLLASTATATLAACGGGGGGGGATSRTSNAGEGNPSFFQTPEFQSSDALQQIDADQGYARVAGNVGGRGVRVAVIDDGIDRGHFDLDDNIAADLGFAGQTEIDNFIDISGLGRDGHGTAVAGVIAAERNGVGSHGVAFDADIVSIDVFSQDDNPNNGSDVTRNIAAAIRSASDGRGESDIINMSLAVFPNGTGQQDDLILDIEDAMRDAADEDKIIVVAAGNDAGANPTLPASFVDNPGIAGFGIAVGSVDANDTISGFSNRCGNTAEFCMVAPGERVRTTLVDDQFGLVSGTSFAAPLVAGSAAVVRAAFPGVGSREVVNRLLSTAVDLGAAGTDAVYGRGRLDLNAALAPVGQLSVNVGDSVDDDGVSATSSQVSFDSSVSLSGNAEALLGRAVVFDDQNFPFLADLNRNVDQRSRTTGIESFVGADRAITSVTTIDQGTVAFSLDEQPEQADPYRREFARSDTSLQKQAEDPQINFRSEAGDGIDLFVSLNGSSSTDLGLDRTIASEEAAFFEQQTFLAPYERLAGLQSGGGASIKIGENTKIGISSFTSADDDALTSMNMQKVELMHRTVGDVELRLGYGLLQEEGGFVGSSASGAFGQQTATDTQFANISLTAPVTDDVSLFGAYSHGRSSTSGTSGSLLDDFSNTASEAFGAGVVVKDILQDDDGFTFMVGQPLRVTSGSADVTVAVGRTEGGAVLTETVRADLSPDRREIATEAVYRMSLGEDGHDLTTGTFVRFNPNHDPDAAPDLGIGIKYRLRF
ncbi:MAG: S8 family peptidase [Geminicoccaceae bacterium]